MSMISTVIASILCAVLYRMGGSGNYPRQARIVGVPAVTCALAFILGCHSWWLLLAMGLMVGMLSTYWDFFFGFDNFWFHGFMLGVAAAPIAYVTGHWLGFALRCVIMAVFMGVWCKVWKWDIAEETGRGAIIPATIFLIV